MSVFTNRLNMTENKGISVTGLDVYASTSRFTRAYQLIVLVVEHCV
jgi:hypothetical protein